MTFLFLIIPSSVSYSPYALARVSVRTLAPTCIHPVLPHVTYARLDFGPHRQTSLSMPLLDADHVNTYAPGERGVRAIRNSPGLPWPWPEGADARLSVCIVRGGPFAGLAPIITHQFCCLPIFLFFFFFFSLLRRRSPLARSLPSLFTSKRSEASQPTCHLCRGVSQVELSARIVWRNTDTRTCGRTDERYRRRRRQAPKKLKN
ncbi:hypothetical protein BC567DRAFT_38851 [Phyllosticta citribraziliensis]